MAASKEQLMSAGKKIRDHRQRRMRPNVFERNGRRIEKLIQKMPKAIRDMFEK